MTGQANATASNATVDGSVATINGVSYQIADIHAVYAEWKTSKAGSIIAFVAIAVVITAVLPGHLFNAYTSSFDPTFRQREQRIYMTPDQIFSSQVFDWLVPLGIICLLVIGLAVFRKMITRDVLVVAFTDGTSEAIEGLERSEAERVQEAIEKAIASREEARTPERPS